MADKSKSSDQDERITGIGDEEIRGVATGEGDEDFDDTEDLDDEGDQEDEESSTF